MATKANGTAGKGEEADRLKAELRQKKEEEAEKANNMKSDNEEKKDSVSEQSPTPASLKKKKKGQKSRNRKNNREGGKNRPPVPMAAKKDRGRNSPRSSNSPTRRRVNGKRGGQGQADTSSSQVDVGDGNHKLYTPWTIYVNKKPDYGRKEREKLSTDQYLERLQVVGHFDTVEGFFAHYRWLKPAKEVPHNFVLSFFRKDANPAWEEFPNGGCWIIRVSRDHEDANVLSRLWEELVLAAIGENFKTPDIAGIMLLKKKSANGKRARDSITIWNKGEYDPNQYMKIGERLRSLCSLDTIVPKDGSKLTIEYKRFKESLLKDKSTTMNARKYVYQPLYT